MKTQAPSQKQRVCLLCLILAATWLYTWGLQRNLPYTIEADENIFVERAVQMASTGNLNPGWFGNPGSTLLYPLVAIYRLWYLWHGSPAPDLLNWFTSAPWSFYFLARLLSVAYTLLAVCLTYQIGRIVFTPTIGLIGVTFLLSYPTMLFHIKSVRTDSVGLLFALLICWFSLQLYRRPSYRYQIMAGIMLGLGVAGRYFLVLFTPLLVWLHWLAWRGLSSSAAGQDSGGHEFVKRTLGGYARGLAVVLLAMGLGFALSTPYFLLDFPTAWHDLVIEGRSTHPGADGLSPLGNFFWYWREITQSQYGALQTGFAVIGLLLIVRRRRLLPLSLVGITVIFLTGLSLSPLHWLRWTMPILPLAALVSAAGLEATVAGLMQGQRQRLYQPLLLALTLAAVAMPGAQSVQLSVQDAMPSTRLTARLWLLQHLPPDARLIQEPYTALLLDDPRVTTTQISLGTEQTVDEYRRAGYTHLVISSYMYDRFLREAARYPKEVAFYQSLLQEREPLVTFTPSWAQGGPTLQIYAITNP
jgi:4-amino-4-deoxy-L-arabinose transferase-like glycosyltransferase